MADINDIRTAIAAALIEVGVTGHLDVRMDGDHAVTSIGVAGVRDLAVAVVVTPLD